MKKASPLLFLTVLVAAVMTYCVIILSLPYQLSPFEEMVTLQPFDQTVLKYALIDISEPNLKQEIEELLQGNPPRNARRISLFTSIIMSKRFLVKARAARGRGLPILVQSPVFRQVWLNFRPHLQEWSKKRSFKRLDDDVLLNVVKMHGLEKKYRSCAVVGNSGILLQSNYGDLIDSHEVVIRLNNARIASFENNVGKKTSISFMNSNILNSCAIRRDDCFCHPYGMDVPIVMYICQPAHFYDYINCNSSHKEPLIVTDPRFDMLCARIVKYYSIKRFIALTGKYYEEWIAKHGGIEFHYSSGMQAVMLAVGVCDKVSIFGFGKSVDAKHHYHTNQSSELGLHDYEAEYDLYRDLVSTPQLIPFISHKFKFPSVDVYH